MHPFCEKVSNMLHLVVKLSAISYVTKLCHDDESDLLLSQIHGATEVLWKNGLY